MIKLYHILSETDEMGGSRNAAKISIALRELGEDFQIVGLNREKDLRPADAPYRRAINPNGVTPAIEEDGLVLWESSAILRYLADSRGKLIGSDVASRARTQQWLSWEGATLQPAFLAYYLAVAEGRSDAAGAAKDAYLDKLTILDRALERGGGYVAGSYSVADIALGPIVPIGFHLGIDLKAHARVASWLDGLSQRAAWRDEPAFTRDMAAGRAGNLL